MRTTPKHADRWLFWPPGREAWAFYACLALLVLGLGSAVLFAVLRSPIKGSGTHTVIIQTHTSTKVLPGKTRTVEMTKTTTVIRTGSDNTVTKTLTVHAPRVTVTATRTRFVPSPCNIPILCR